MERGLKEQDRALRVIPSGGTSAQREVCRQDRFANPQQVLLGLHPDKVLPADGCDTFRRRRNLGLELRREPRLLLSRVLWIPPGQRFLLRLLLLERSWERQVSQIFENVSISRTTTQSSFLKELWKKHTTQKTPGGCWFGLWAPDLLWAKWVFHLKSCAAEKAPKKRHKTIVVDTAMLKWIFWVSSDLQHTNPGSRSGFVGLVLAPPFPPVDWLDCSPAGPRSPAISWLALAGCKTHRTLNLKSAKMPTLMERLFTPHVIVFISLNAIKHAGSSLTVRESIWKI